MFAALVSGTLIPASGSSAACPTWPLCGGQLAILDAGSWVQLGHRLVVGLVAIQVAWLLVKAWTTERDRVVNLVLATTIAVLYLGQGLIGGLQVVRSDDFYLHSLHSATSAAIWVALVFLVVYTGLTYKKAGGEARRVVTPSSGLVGTMRDYLSLTKPIVVLLLLLTTYGGMVVGGRVWPASGLTLITMVGGALAAGGSSAINQYIDRRRDRLMVRTAKRPIAAGRLSPAEGLSFGVALCLLAFYLLAGLVNFLTAMLAVAGILYYVVLYSLLLKNATVQNIVIGGGAGAIPPLVGWAAVTGDLTVAGMMLFVVIFFWTPPHFWALALVRRNDYARAGVPMLPVVRGEAETRWQIFLYTLALVAITLLLPFFGLGQGAVYIVSAALLGLWLISSAYRVWRGSGNKIAWKMYRHSSMYLAFLFVALMIDAVI
jgi:protoheme IX farnesyltransferase